MGQPSRRGMQRSRGWYARRMERRRFGANRTEVAVIGQGTWQIDTGHRPTAIAALQHGLDMGMTHVDTAEMYGDAEPLVADAISGRRDEVFLVSKVLPEHASRRSTVTACERSLRRLRTDRLDCYLLHWRGVIPLEETVAAFGQLERAGKIRSWGVSNFDVADLEEVWRLGPSRPACNQVLYHLGERAIEHDVAPWCAARGIAVVGYSPFGHRDGFPGPRSRGGTVLAAIAAAHEATPRQVALRFLTRAPGTFTIPKAGSPEHADENARAVSLRLSDADVARIDAAFPIGPRPRALPTL
jgi:diketogulonate reductase-like aldo/keto reductase